MSREESTTLEEAKEALSILAGQCGNAKLRIENKRILMDYIKSRCTVGDWLHEMRLAEEARERMQADVDELRRRIRHVRAVRREEFLRECG